MLFRSERRFLPGEFHLRVIPIAKPGQMARQFAPDRVDARRVHAIGCVFKGSEILKGMVTVLQGVGPSMSRSFKGSEILKGMVTHG